MTRHDPARTGLASGTANIDEPEVFWRYYLGGRLGANELLVVDVDANGQADVLYLSGGRVLASRNDGSALWSSAPLGLSSLLAVEDYDGDGVTEVAVASRDTVYLLDSATGAQRWAEPPGEMGTIGGVRSGDLNGDGLHELVIEECACCGVNSGNPGYVHSFAAGFEQPTRLWTFPFARCGGGGVLTLVDTEGTGRFDVLLGDSLNLALIDGVTGVEKMRTPTMWQWIHGANCLSLDVDGEPGEELVCFQTIDLTLSDEVRRVMLLKPVLGSNQLSIVWQRVMAPNNGGGLEWVEPVVDLDANGSLELLVSVLDTGVWSARVLDLETGFEAVVLPDEKVLGVLPGSAGAKTLLTWSGTAVTGWSYDASRLPAIEKLWTLQDYQPFVQPVPSLRLRSSVNQELIVVDFDQDGLPDLPTRSIGDSAELNVWSLATGTPVSIKSFPYPARFEALVHWLLPPLNRPYPQLAVSRDDGYLTVFDAQLSPIDIGQDGGIPGIRIGGYYAPGAWRSLGSSPLAVSFDGEPAEALVTRDSRSALVRIDATEASSSVSPSKVWERRAVRSASIVAGMNAGEPGVAVQTSEQLELLAGDGSALWSVAAPSAVLGDLVPGQFDDDGFPDLAFQWGDPTNTLIITRTISGADG
ncbi:MAG: VCBS repeat-containing protein, partial [Myxococcota bacterium]|nr:VCBS repeat-containing protein [Myxococcota bacterium]